MVVSLEEDSLTPRERYSVFTTTQRWCIVGIVAYAAWFSTLSSFIYFPALKSISQALSVSVDKVNLTITSYLAVATIAPTLTGDAADTLGRRPIYLITLSVYLVSNVAIALTNSYPALVGLRVLQALAISGTFSTAYGVVTDIASPAERGSYVSAVSFAGTVAPSLGPILGGFLTYAGNWHWIFWFLSIASAVCLFLIAVFLPETSRNVVGNGSRKPPRYLRPLVPALTEQWEEWEEKGIPLIKTSRRPNPLRSLKILVRRDNATVIMACGLLYVVFTCINASLSVLFIDMYGLNQWQAGLSYLPLGLGGTISTFFSGWLIDRAYRKARVTQGLTVDRGRGDDLEKFDIEKARLSVIWIPSAATIVTIVVMGWALNYKQHIAFPLSLLFITGLCMTLGFSIYNTLLVDKNQQNPSAAQASSNIVRCGLAAVAVSFLDDMLVAWGVGWTFTFMGGLCVCATGLFVIDYYYGALWRQNRAKNSHD
ncbi:MFS general substrate transporter [Lophiostoma macrostomum CBS 122681]|uniref:MFS general substrate transporter n=1 Tax=Lophiostoma macrostomum CBS 122681 TaxID=1314788 RepID=A0A6A6TS69_9PLEO|nr:MFS general substrate transporter [Lophiostoma macrostomum CBS 122681]